MNPRNKDLPGDGLLFIDAKILTAIAAPLRADRFASPSQAWISLLI
jgi:hypothetical protein